jgi:YgiT-type zinc finger domain-containing protein
MAPQKPMCPNCGKGKLIKDLERRSMTYKGRTIIYDVPGATCRNCGQRYIAPPGAAAAGDQVRAHEAAIDARERRKVKY